MQHLLSLRYHMLADAVNIKEDCELDYCGEAEAESCEKEYAQMVYHEAFYALL